MMMQPIDFNLFHPEPLLLVISGPSGVGKDATLNSLKRRKSNLHFVITVTSRPIRAEEREGVDYYFVTTAQFEEMIRRNEFIEYAHVYADYKGIPKKQIEQAFDSGKDVILRLDVQGAARIRALYPEAVLIFLIPENQDEWLKRLMERKTETEESLALRVETARKELACLPDFDYIVVNSEGHLEETVDTIENILSAEHHCIQHRKVKR